LTYQELFCAALRLVSEYPEVGENADYEDRSAYLLPPILSAYAPLDRAYRRAYGLEEQAFAHKARVDLSEELSLCDAFAAPISLSLASLLVAQENPKLSERLHDVAETAVESIRLSIPFVLESIKNRYL